MGSDQFQKCQCLGVTLLFAQIHRIFNILFYFAWMHGMFLLGP